MANLFGRPRRLGSSAGRGHYDVFPLDTSLYFTVNDIGTSGSSIGLADYNGSL